MLVYALEKACLSPFNQRPRSRLGIPCSAAPLKNAKLLRLTLHSQALKNSGQVPSRLILGLTVKARISLTLLSAEDLLTSVAENVKGLGDVIGMVLCMHCDAVAKLPSNRSPGRSCRNIQYAFALSLLDYRYRRTRQVYSIFGAHCTARLETISAPLDLKLPPM